MTINNQMTTRYAIYFCPYYPVVPASQQHSIDYKSKTLRRYVPNRSANISITILQNILSLKYSYQIAYTIPSYWGASFAKHTRTKGLTSHHDYELDPRSPRPRKNLQTIALKQML